MVWLIEIEWLIDILRSSNFRWTAGMGKLLFSAMCCCSDLCVWCDRKRSNVSCPTSMLLAINEIDAADVTDDSIAAKANVWRVTAFILTHLLSNVRRSGWKLSVSAKASVKTKVHQHVMDHRMPLNDGGAERHKNKSLLLHPWDFVIVVSFKASLILGFTIHRYQTCWKSLLKFYVDTYVTSPHKNNNKAVETNNRNPHIHHDGPLHRLPPPSRFDGRRIRTSLRESACGEYISLFYLHSIRHEVDCFVRYHFFC